MPEEWAIYQAATPLRIMWDGATGNYIYESTAAARRARAHSARLARRHPARLCSECNRFRRETETRSNGWRDRRDGRTVRRYICDGCLHDADFCGFCGRYVRRDRLSDGVNTEHGRRLCPECLHNFHPCSECAILTNYGVTCGRCYVDPWEDDDYQDSGDGWCCESCNGPRSGYRDRPVINSYNFRPAPLFLGDGPLYLGAELEIGTDSVDRYHAARIALDALGPAGYLKEDSSIGDGFEIVTHPMSPEWARKSFPWEMLDRLAECGAEATNHCGLHVHVSRDGFSSELHTYRWVKLWYRNVREITRIARRSSDAWAPWSSDDRRDAKRLAKKNARGSGRYRALNFTNPRTIECRVFASTLDVTEMRAALDLVAGSVEYTRELTAADIAKRRAWEWGAFREWVSDRSEYAALSTMMGS